MILKAGTYRFNDTLTFDAIGEALTEKQYTLPFYFVFTSSGETANVVCDYLSIKQEQYEDEDDRWLVNYNATDFGKITAYSSWSGWTTDSFPNIQDVTITEDTEVDDTFGTWYIANTNYNEVNAKPLAEITYNGETIAQLNAGETATLSCEGKKMVSDVVVKVNEVESKIPDGYIKPEGSLPITENGTYPVTDKEEVVVDVPTTTDGVPVEMLNQAVMNELIAPNSTKGDVGAVYLYHGEASETYEYGALYILEEVSE